MQQKIQAYITREQNGRTELLVFGHVGIPEAGVQVPAGSIDPGETPDRAVLREIFEETGLVHLQIVKYLGCFPWYWTVRQTLHQRHVYHLTPAEPLPDRWEQVVASADADNGLRFECYWLDVNEAARVLSGQQGMYLELL